MPAAAPFWASTGADAAYLFLTGDAYLYLGIAEHSTADFFSFDGERPTNGFHPLWQYYLRLVAQFTGDNSIALMNISALSGIACCWIGVILLGMAVARGAGSWLLAGFVVPGVYFLLVGQGVGGNLAVWNFFNGMESGLALALTGAIALTAVHVQPDDRRVGFWLGLGVLTGLLMLCRLDEVFVSAAIGLTWLLWHPKRIVSRVWAVMLLGIPPALMLAGYFAYNLSYMDALMPISGSAKGEGALVQNGWVTLANFFAPLIDIRETLTDYIGNHGAIGSAAFRVAQLLFPALMALGFIVLLFTKFRETPWAPIVAGMCAAIVLKAGYNFVFVGYWHQASWYFSFAQGTISLVTALLVASLVGYWRTVAPLAVGLIVMLIVSVSFLQASKSYLARADRSHVSERQMFYEAQAEIDAALEARFPTAKVMEFGDGMINFTLDRPVRHGFVFAGDIDSLTALQNGQLLQSAYEDGYRIMTSFEYYRWPSATLEKTSDEIRDRLLQSGANYGIREELGNFNFEVIYIYEPLNIPFISFSPR